MFYLNLVVAIIGFILSMNISIMVGATVVGVMCRSHLMHLWHRVCILRSLFAIGFTNRVGSGIMGAAFAGMFALLLAAQFAHCWTIVVGDGSFFSHAVHDLPDSSHFEYRCSGDLGGRV